MSTALTLFALAAVALWAGSVLAAPLRTCRRCHGARITTAGGGRRIRRRTCHACSGTGIRRRLGATTIHRLYWLFHDHTEQARPEPARPANDRERGEH